MEPDTRDNIVDYIAEKKKQTGIAEKNLLNLIGISRRKFHDWKKSYGNPWKLSDNLIKSNHLEEWEKDKIVEFYLNHEQDGYRRCTYMMIDQDIVYTTPSTVYNVLSQRGAINRKQVKSSKKGNGFKQPLTPHRHWHSDITNVQVGDRIYFLISVLDGYSRSIIAWDLRESMKSQDTGIVFQKAKERYPEAKPVCITDNGKQYKCSEFKQFIKRNSYEHRTTSPYYPQSNGKQERFHGSIKTECLRIECPLSKSEAVKVIAEYIDYYNTERLHSSIDYLAPFDKLAGKKEEILSQRDAKLEARRLERKELRKTA